MRHHDRVCRISVGICLGLCVGTSVTLGCRSKPKVEPSEAPEAPPSPDRLTAEERLPDSETAFGLPVPSGMRLTQHFKDSAYFTGEARMDRVLEHLQKYLATPTVELQPRHALFARAMIKGDESQRLFRISVSETSTGTQLHITDITPPPTTRGASQAELWSRAGRKPDGTPIDQNQLY